MRNTYLYHWPIKAKGVLWEKMIIRSEALEFRAGGAVLKTEKGRLKANPGSFTSFPSAATSSLLICLLVHLSRQNFRLHIRQYGIVVRSLGSRTK